MKKFQRAGSLCMRYNQTGEEEQELRRKILEEFFGKCGEDTLIVLGFRCQYGENIFLEDHVTINFNCTLMDNTDHPYRTPYIDRPELQPLYRQPRPRPGGTGARFLYGCAHTYRQSCLVGWRCSCNSGSPYR